MKNVRKCKIKITQSKYYTLKTIKKNANPYKILALVIIYTQCISYTIRTRVYNIYSIRL